MRFRPTGWQRIGVIISGLWFVAFGVWLWLTAVSDFRRTHEQLLGGCYAIAGLQRDALGESFGPSNDPKRDAKFNGINDELKTCIDKADKIDLVSFNELRSWCSWLILAVDLGSIALAWLFAWMIVGLTQWVRRGFYASSADAAGDQ